MWTIDISGHLLQRQRFRVTLDPLAAYFVDRSPEARMFVASPLLFAGRAVRLWLPEVKCIRNVQSSPTVNKTLLDRDT